MWDGIGNKMKIIGIAIVALLVVIVALQNTQTVETKLLFLTVTMPNAALLFGLLTRICGWLLEPMGDFRCKTRRFLAATGLSNSSTRFRAGSNAVLMTVDTAG